MLRLSVPAGERLYAAHQLQARIGGTESNVLVALAALGRRTAWHSQVPDNPLGQMVIRNLRAAGVDTESVVADPNGGRLGIYYYEPSSGPLPGEVVYDRAESSFARLRSEAVHWSELLDTCVVHLTGITPALGEQSRQLFFEVLQRAKDANVAVSLDVNYRQKLWHEHEASETLHQALPFVDLIICGLADAHRVFGLAGEPHEILAGLTELNDGRDTVLTCGADGAIAWSDGQKHSVAVVETTIVDRLGTGDAFAAGLIDGWLDGSMQAGLERGAVLAAVKLSQRGDTIDVGRRELELLINHADQAKRILR